MNRSSAIFAPVFLFAVGATALTTGCASTSTQASLGETVDDSVITTKVKAQMVEDPVVKASQVGVETMQGVVQLSGFVPSKDLSVRAEQIARRVDGVRGVKNDLVVR